MCLSLMMKAQAPEVTLRRFFDYWSTTFPVLVFDDGVGVVDFGGGLAVHLEAGPAELKVTRLCEECRSAGLEPASCPSVRAMRETPRSLSLLRAVML